MSMPNHLFLVRHGESEGNVAQSKAWEGDLSSYTDAYVTTPGRQWSLTAVGRAQAALTGTWLRASLAALPAEGQRHFVSPYLRTQQTAHHLGLDDVRWYLNRALRERDWGDIETMPKSQFEQDPDYANNVRKRAMDPLYWRPPGGESIADVAENRVRNVLDTLHRECSGGVVVAVTHGELMRAMRVVLERADDETYTAWEADPATRIGNCEVLHYTRVDPASGEVAGRIAWLRRVVPDVDAGAVVVGGWAPIEYRLPLGKDLPA